MLLALQSLSDYYTPQRIVTCLLAHNALGYWVSFMPALIVWWMLISFDRISIEISKILFGKAMQYMFVPLLAGFLGGIFNNAVDFDHITLFFGHANGRVCHEVFLIIAIIVAIISGIGTCLMLCGKITQNGVYIAITLITWTTSLSVISHVVEDYMCKVSWF